MLRHMQLAVIQNRKGISRILVRAGEGDHLLQNVGELDANREIIYCKMLGNWMQTTISEKMGQPFLLKGCRMKREKTIAC